MSIADDNGDEKLSRSEVMAHWVHFGSMGGFSSRGGRVAHGEL